MVGTNGPQKCGSVSRPNIDFILSSFDDYPYCLLHFFFYIMDYLQMSTLYAVGVNTVAISFCISVKLFLFRLIATVEFFSNYRHLNDYSLRIENEQPHIVIATPQRSVC